MDIFMNWFRGLNLGHRRAVIVLTTSLALLWLDSIIFAAAEHISLWLGLYNILADAETFGGVTPPTNALGYACLTAVCLLLIPLLGSTISLVTSGLTETQVKKSTDEIKTHHASMFSEFEDRQRERHEELKQHISNQIGHNGQDAQNLT
jgi:hypothetical protein